jgi:hypothetical protein
LTDPTVTAVEVREWRTVTVVLQVSGLPKVKANSTEGLPAWSPDSLSLTFHEFDGHWVLPDHGTLHGQVQRGVGSVSRGVEKTDALWSWVAEQIVANFPQELLDKR